MRLGVGSTGVGNIKCKVSRLILQHGPSVCDRLLRILQDAPGMK